VFHGQPEWSKAEHNNQGLQFDAELDALSEAMKDVEGRRNRENRLKMVAVLHNQLRNFNEL